MIQVKYRNPDELNGLTSKYNHVLHLPIPTLTFVKEMTGEDLILNTGSSDKANALVNNLCITAWTLLKSSKTAKVSNQMEYLIAVDENWRNEFLIYVTSFISDVYALGYIDELNKPVGDSKLINQLTFNSRARLDGSHLLRANNLGHINYEYRKGY